MVHWGHVFQAVRLADWARATGTPLWLNECGTALLGRARNRLMRESIKQGAAWALFVDADGCHLDVRDIASMLETGEREGAAVIGAPVAMRGRDGYNAVALDDIKRWHTREEMAGKVQPVARIGAGFLALRLGWFVKHWPAQPWFQLEYREGGSEDGLAEDYYLCDGVRVRGGTVLCDGRFWPQHFQGRACEDVGILAQLVGGTAIDLGETAGG
jgi:hypothetical protein